MKCFQKNPFFFLALLTLLCPVSASAAISIQGSRVVYDESRGEATVQLKQVGDAPGLVQIWLDNGDDSLNPKMQDVPFLITPSVARVEPGGGQSIRVMRIGEALPQDRESMFFFNVLEVPPKPTQLVDPVDNYIQFSSRARLKFFYRPKGLVPSPVQAYELLRFALVPDESTQTDVQVRIYNPSPYHITFRELGLRGESATVATLSPRIGAHQTTVPPMGELLLPLETTVDSSILHAAGLQVAFAVIGDLGNIFSGLRALE